MAKKKAVQFIPAGYLCCAHRVSQKRKRFLRKFNSGISKTKCSAPKWKGVDALGNAPSQYTGKFLPGFYLSRGLKSWRYG
jgi:hypothetical protein